MAGYPSERGLPIPGDPPDALRSSATEPVPWMRTMASLTQGDPHRTARTGEPGSGGAPGGPPVAPPGESPPAGPVAPPGTAEGGAAGGPPAFHREVPR